MAFEASVIADATVLTFTGGIITESYTVGGADVDMFAVDLVGGRMYEFDSDGGNDTFLRIFDAFGNEVARQDDGADSGESASTNPYMQFMANYTGRYYVAYSAYYLTAYDPTSPLGRVAPDNGLLTFTTTLTVTDNGTEFFPDFPSINAIGAASPADESSAFASGSGPFRIEYADTTFVSASGDIEMGRFDLQKGDTLVVDINGRGFADELDNVIRVFTDTGVEIAFDNGNGSGEDSELVFAAPNTGDFYIAVSGDLNTTYNPLDGSGTLIGDSGFFTAIIHRNPTILGTSGSNTRAGTEGADYLVLLAGNDTATGGDGRDTLCGGDDTDSLSGGNGGDVLYGEHDNDILSGDKGNDVLSGGQGLDTLNGGKGNDIVQGGAGADSLLGSDGLDTLYGDAGFDSLEGGAGNDSLLGGADDDLLLADDGNDTASGEAGNDTVQGGTGDDSLLGGTGLDSLDGGRDNDVLDGGSEADQLIGGTGRDTLAGGTGDDTLTGGRQDDTFVFLNTASGVDTITDFDAASAFEVIDLSAIFAATGAIVTAGNLAQHIQITPAGAGADSFLAVDANGLTGGLDFTIIAQVNGVTAATLFDIGNFIL
jgi:Ca2+-binding RTX toxin-like protein